MKNSLLHALSIVLLCLLGACQNSEPEEPATPEQAETGAGSQHQPPMEVVIDPFTGEARNTPKSKVELPEDAFYQEHMYPGAEIVQVQDMMGLTTVLLRTKDSWDEVDAHYRQKFTRPDGEVDGRPGNYYRSVPGRRRNETVKFSTTETSGCRIALSK